MLTWYCSARMVKQIGGDQETLQWYSAMIQEMLSESGDESTDSPGEHHT